MTGSADAPALPADPAMKAQPIRRAAVIGELFHKPLWQATEAIWRDLGEVSVDAELAGRVAEELDRRDIASVPRHRDVALMLPRLKAGMIAQP